MTTKNKFINKLFIFNGVRFGGSWKWIVNISLLLVIIGVCLLFSESVVRLLYKKKMVLFPRYHTDAVYGEYHIRRLRPKFVFWHTSIDGKWKFTTNSQGFRDYRDYKYEKPKNTLRILVMGDSHTEGFEVRQEHTFSIVAEKYMNLHHSPLKAEVFNTGVSGFSTAEELVFLENEGIKYNPNIAVLAFYANDLDDNIKSGLFEIRNGVLAIKSKRHVPGVAILNFCNRFGILRWLSENSYLYSLSFNTIWDRAKKNLLAKNASELQTEFAIPQGEISEYQILLESKLIERMYNFCKNKGIKLIIVDIPKFDKNSNAVSSLPPHLNETVVSNCDGFIRGADVLHDYNGIAEIFLPHGHRHISEITHLMIGVAIAKEVERVCSGYALFD